MKRPDPIEIVAVAAPLIAEAVAVTFAIAVAIMLAALWCEVI